MRRTSVQLLGFIDIEPRVSHRAQSIGLILLQTAAEQSSNGLRRVWRKLSPIRFRCEHAGQNLACRRGREEGSAGQHLEQDAAEGPHIGSSVGSLSLDLLGRHVCRGTEQRARHGHHRRCMRQQAADGRGFDHFRQAKIQDLDRPVHLDLDVGRLQIAMDDAVVMRVLHALGNLARNRQRIGKRQRAARQAF